MGQKVSDTRWLGDKIRHAIGRAGTTRGQLATLLGGLGLQVSRQSVYDWCRTGQVDKKWLPILAKELGVKVEYFLTAEAAYEPLVQDEDVSPEESALVLAFRDLLPEQQEHYLREVRAEADKNRAVAERFARRYGRSVPDSAVAVHIEPAPRAKPTRKKQS